jgi:4-amino-4-deoxy-L-arabinose transferase-like glycosyltransferase
MSFLKKHKIILAILLGALFIRVIGIDYGIPHRFVGDEFVQVAIALTMLEEKAFIPYFPNIFYHQPFSAYISTIAVGGFLAWQTVTGVFESFADMRTFYAIQPEALLLVTRFTAALFGALSVLFLYCAAKELFSKRVGLIAAFFASIDFLTVYIHHTGRVWSYMSFFIALGLWASVKLYKNDSVKNYVTSVFATLIAAATLLPGIFVFVPSLVARGFRNKKMWVSSTVLVLGVFIILAMNPRGLGALLFRFQSLSGSSLIERVTGEAITYQVSETSIVDRIFEPFLTLFSYSPIFFILFFIALFFLWVRDRKTFWFLASFPIVYYLFIGPFFTFGWVARTLVPLSLYLALGAAYATDMVITRLHMRTRATIVSFILLLSLPSITSSLWLDATLLKTDTREQALEWIYSNLEEDEKILSFSFTNEVINQNRGVLELTREVVPEKLDTRQKTLLAGEDNIYPKPYYFAWDLRDIPAAELPDNFFKNQEFRYYLRTDWGGKDHVYFNELIESKFSDKELIVRFSPFNSDPNSIHEFASQHNMQYPFLAVLNAERFGPIVEIYRITWK